MQKTTFLGIAKGKTIELDSDCGLPPGQPVTITIQPKATDAAPGDGIRRSAGAWADDAEELDRYLETARQLRHAGNRLVP